LAVLVIAGSGRGAGKTAVGCALIAALPELRWVAVKVTPHLHRDEEIWEEVDFRSGKDTGRYLAAGAGRAFLVGGVGVADAAGLVVGARSRAALCDGLLVESNRITAGSVARPGERVVTLAVLAGAEAEWKASLRECVGGVDALVLGSGLDANGFESPFRRKPVFSLGEGHWCVPELVRFVRGRLVG
jgi:hypothetical protein